MLFAPFTLARLTGFPSISLSADAAPVTMLPVLCTPHLWAGLWLRLAPTFTPPSAWGAQGLPCTILRQLCALVPSSSSHSLIYWVYLSLLQQLPFAVPYCSELWSLHSSHSSGGAAGHQEGLSPSLGHSR